jgi:hypothetical protein
MKRTILALAIAGLSIAAYASPPPGGGPPMPIEVNVTNPLPIPVTSIPRMTSLSEFLAPTFTADPNGITVPSPYSDVVLTGFLVRVENRSSDNNCNVALVLNHGEPDAISLFGSFFYAGQSVATYVPLPNLYLPEGTTVFMYSSSPVCFATATVQMIRAQ